MHGLTLRAMLEPWRRRLHWAWVACFAILLNAWAPAVSQALAAQRGAAPWGLICSASNLASPDGAPQPAQPAASGEHCPFCLSHAGSFALPPAAAPAVAVAVPAQVTTASAPRTPKARDLPAWALARAPPTWA